MGGYLLKVIVKISAAMFLEAFIEVSTKGKKKQMEKQDNMSIQNLAEHFFFKPANISNQQILTLVYKNACVKLKSLSPPPHFFPLGPIYL